jgi:error-prone DNA polymerase
MVSAGGLMEYAELHCHSNYSFLDGASHPDFLVQRAKELGLSALALTDHDGLYGTVKFFQSARYYGIKALLGTEMTLEGGAHLLLLAHDRTGYSSLCRMVSLSQLAHVKGRAALPPTVLEANTDGLTALSACKKGAIAAAMLKGRPDEARRAAEHYRDLFGPNNFYIEIQQTLCPEDRSLTRDLLKLARSLDLPVAATNNVHYARREEHRLQDVLVAIRHRATLETSQHLRRPNSEYHLKSHDEMTRLFREIPEAITNTTRIAESCNVQLDLSGYRFPDFPVPGDEEADTFLEKLCREKIRVKYPDPEGEPTERLEDELRLIRQLGLAGYFLTVWDIMEFARRRDIPAQGRGSAASSIVTYLLGVTRVDPVRHQLFAGRFLNDEMSAIPDIDIDIASDREGHREEIIQYIYGRYGAHHAAMLCNVVSYRARNAVREVGKALGLPSETVESMAKTVEHHSARGVVEDLSRLSEFKKCLDSGPWKIFLSLVEQISNFPRHLGIHVGGMVISTSPLIDLVPVERATMPGRVVTQWDKDDINELGLIKIDLLGLRMLSLIDEAVKLVKETRGLTLDLDNLPLDDHAVYDMLCRGDTLGVFQVESRAQMATLPRSQPRIFDDLVAEVAIIRPGPIQGHAVHPYLNRRQGREPVSYIHPLLEPILKETLGVIIYQEQVIQAAMTIAGFSPGQADALRRAMSKKRSREAMESLRNSFLEGARRNGVNEITAGMVFESIAGFAAFGFCKAHAAALAGTTYRSAWLKLYYPGEFFCSMLNCQPMGFYSPEVIVNHARRQGIAVMPVDVNRSHYRCRMEGNGFRLGFRYVKNVGEAAWKKLEQGRQAGPYLSLADFHRRVDLSSEAVESLVGAGAFDFTGAPRRQLLWERRKAARRHEGGLDLAWADCKANLPAMTAGEELAEEYALQGLSARAHPMTIYRPTLDKTGVLDSRAVNAARDGSRVTAAGCVVCRQRPLTAKGHVFITLEDEHGLVNAILRPDVYDRYRQTARHEPFLVIGGMLQKKDGTVNIIADQLKAMAREDEELETPAPRAKNFC